MLMPGRDSHALFDANLEKGIPEGARQSLVTTRFGCTGYGNPIGMGPVQAAKVTGGAAVMGRPPRRSR